MDSIIQCLYNEFKDEVETVRMDLIVNVSKQECSTSVEDCLFLYLLIRYFKPKTILEIGTFVGSTLLSIVKACEKNNQDYQIYTIDLEDNLKVSLTEDQKSHITFFHMHSDYATNLISEKIDFIFADADLTEMTAKKLSPNMDASTIFATHDFVPPLDKGITSLVNIFEYSDLRQNHIIVPNHTVNWIYHSKWEDSYHDSFTKEYLKDRSVRVERTHMLGINLCMAIILPVHYKETFQYKDYFDKYTLYRNNLEGSYYYDVNDKTIILNSLLVKTTPIQVNKQILCRLEDDVPKFIGFLQ
jgi:hypothetical protein